MAQTGFTPLINYHSTTSGNVPTTANLAVGEIAVNVADKKLYITDGTSIYNVSGGATGGGTDQVFVNNGQTVTTSYTIPTNFNAMSTGPISISAGVTVTIPAGSVWAVI
jgi:hypothetical protein